MQCEFVVAACVCGTMCAGCGSGSVGRFFGGSMAAKQVDKWRFRWEGSQASQQEDRQRPTEKHRDRQTHG